MNYFLCLPSTDDINNNFKAGEIGVGLTSMSPGITDCLAGIMYIAPDWFVKNYCLGARNPKPEWIKAAVLAYWRNDGKQRKNVHR